MTVDLGDYRPESAIGPVRLDNGVTQLGRATTTEEQRRDAEHWMVEQIREKHGAISTQDDFKARIMWSRGEPTVLIMQVRIERLPENLGVLYLPDDVQERTVKGAEIMSSGPDRARRLVQEVAELADKGMLS